MCDSDARRRGAARGRRGSVMPTSVLARVGVWCFRHWGRVLVLWLVAVVAGILSFGPVFGRLVDNNANLSNVESIKANDELREGGQSAGTVIGIVSGVDPSSAAVATAVTATADQIGRV